MINDQIKHLYFIQSLTDLIQLFSILFQLTTLRRQLEVQQQSRDFEGATGSAGATSVTVGSSKVSQHYNTFKTFFNHCLPLSVH